MVDSVLYFFSDAMINVIDGKIPDAVLQRMKAAVCSLMLKGPGLSSKTKGPMSQDLIGSSSRAFPNRKVQTLVKRKHVREYAIVERRSHIQ